MINSKPEEKETSTESLAELAPAPRYSDLVVYLWSSIIVDISYKWLPAHPHHTLFLHPSSRLSLAFATSLSLSLSSPPPSPPLASILLRPHSTLLTR